MMPYIFRTNLPDTSAKSTLELPQVLFGGIAWNCTDKLVLETGILWEGWADYRKIKTEFDTPLNGMNSITIEKNRKDTITTNIGIEYLYNERFTFSTGYLYRENSIPDSTFDPSLPDADAHMFALGGYINWQKYTLSLAYVYEKQKSREKNTYLGNEIGGNANGTYCSDAHFLALSLNLHF